MVDILICSTLRQDIHQMWSKSFRCLVADESLTDQLKKGTNPGRLFNSTYGWFLTLPECWEVMPDFMLISVTPCVTLNPSIALLNVLITCWFIATRSFRASLSTSLAGAPAMKLYPSEWFQVLLTLSCLQRIQDKWRIHMPLYFYTSTLKAGAIWALQLSITKKQNYLQMIQLLLPNGCNAPKSKL